MATPAEQDEEVPVYTAPAVEPPDDPDAFPRRGEQDRSTG